MFSEAVSWLTHFFDELSQLTDSIGALIKPYIRYPDGTEALVYLEEWRSTSGKVEISKAVLPSQMISIRREGVLIKKVFPEGMIDVLPSGASQAPLYVPIAMTPTTYQDHSIFLTLSIPIADALSRRNSAIRELWEEAGIKTSPQSPISSPHGSTSSLAYSDRRRFEPAKEKVTLTLLDQERIEHGLQ